MRQFKLLKYELFRNTPKKISKSADKNLTSAILANQLSAAKKIAQSTQIANKPIRINKLGRSCAFKFKNLITASS